MRYRDPVGHTHKVPKYLSTGKCLFFHQLSLILWYLEGGKKRENESRIKLKKKKFSCDRRSFICSKRNPFQLPFPFLRPSQNLGLFPEGRYLFIPFIIHRPPVIMILVRTPFGQMGSASSTCVEVSPTVP